LKADDLYQRIVDLTREMAELVRSEDDLSSPQVIALSRELDEVAVLYQRLRGN